MVNELKYFINSNNGDYIEYGDKIILVTNDGYKEISETEFKELKGFLPIKKKKMDILKGRGHLFYMPLGSKQKWDKYKPTQKGGKK